MHEANIKSLEWHFNRLLTLLHERGKINAANTTFGHFTKMTIDYQG